MRIFLTILALSLGLNVTPEAAKASACKKPGYSSAFLKPVPTRGINQALFSQAMQMEADFARCQRGRGHLVLAPKLTGIAAGHSGWMAKAKKLNHKSTRAGMRTMSNRVRSTGLAFRTAAENIAAYDRFSFPEGQFKILNASACKFATQGGKAIPAHSYASLAQAVVAGWMGSPPHRKNLLNGRISMVGSGLAFDGTAPFCGRFYITQNYLG
jgi:uncharacterized protein YkwD